MKEVILIVYLCKHVDQIEIDLQQYGNEMDSYELGYNRMFLLTTIVINRR